METVPWQTFQQEQIHSYLSLSFVKHYGVSLGKGSELHFFPQIRGPVDIKAGKYMALANTFGVGENIQNPKREDLRFPILQTPPAFNLLVFSFC